MYNLRMLGLQDIEGSEPRKVLKRRSPSEVVEYVREKLCDSLMLPGEPLVTLELGDEHVTLEADITDHRYARHGKKPNSAFIHFVRSTTINFTIQLEP